MTSSLSDRVDKICMVITSSMQVNAANLDWTRSVYSTKQIFTHQHAALYKVVEVASD